jgi:hypothetical protein
MVYSGGEAGFPCFDFEILQESKETRRARDHVYGTERVRRNLFEPSILLRSYRIVAVDLAGALENLRKGLQLASVLPALP